MREIAEAGHLEVFGGADKSAQPLSKPQVVPSPINQDYMHGLDVTPFKIAYAKLPYLLRSRRYHQSRNAA